MQNNSTRLENWRFGIFIFATVVMLATVTLQIAINNPLIHVIGCISIILSMIPLLILDKKCNCEEFSNHIFWLALWIFNLVLTCTRL